jgi:hypothetical protein
MLSDFIIAKAIPHIMHVKCDYTHYHDIYQLQRIRFGVAPHYQYSVGASCFQEGVDEVTPDAPVDAAASTEAPDHNEGM